MKVCLLPVALMLAAALCSPAYCATYPVDLLPAKWRQIGGVCTYDLDLEWPYRLGGLDQWLLRGCCPPSSEDPCIRQNIANGGDDTWTEWHITIDSGANLRGITAYKVGEGTLWPCEPLPGVCGFVARVVPTGGPENPMAVQPGQTLHVEFTYDVAGSPVTVTQYPTDWRQIPELSTLPGLLAGVVAFTCGRSLSRRRIPPRRLPM